MKLFVPKVMDNTKTISFRIPNQLSVRLDKVRDKAGTKGLALPVNNHLVEQLERFVSAAERELATLAADKA